MFSEREIKKQLKEFGKRFLPRAVDDDEAAERYAEWGCCDPYYNEIEPALLNSKDILSYVAATGMIHPFQADLAHLHPATYAVPLKGTCIRWKRDNLRSKQVEEIDDGEEFHLPQDSVAFLTLEPALRIPDYIALRFNLRVDNAYRGLLLGTGPLVDPGFQGRLAIPLHNFTTNDYVFTGGERLIWMEFTKLSKRKEWNPPPEKDLNRVKRIRENAIYIPYKPDDYEATEPLSSSPCMKQAKQEHELPTVQKHLRDAAPQSPVFSSTRHALETANRTRDRVRQISLLGGAFILIGLAALIYPGVEHLRQTQQEIRQLHNNISDLEKRIERVEAGRSAPTRSRSRTDVSDPGSDETIGQPASQSPDDNE